MLPKVPKGPLYKEVSLTNDKWHISYTKWGPHPVIIQASKSIHDHYLSFISWHNRFISVRRLSLISLSMGLGIIGNVGMNWLPLHTQAQEYYRYTRTFITDVLSPLDHIDHCISLHLVFWQITLYSNLTMTSCVPQECWGHQHPFNRYFPLWLNHWKRYVSLLSSV